MGKMWHGQISFCLQTIWSSLANKFFVLKFFFVLFGRGWPGLVVLSLHFGLVTACMAKFGYRFFVTKCLVKGKVWFGQVWFG